MDNDIDNILNGLIARVYRVRCWLIARCVLRIAAVGLACICAYIGLYAWIDHHAHFNHWGRLTALLVLVLLLICLGYLLARTLRRDMKYSHAASYVESRRSFGQQLVAAVEYFEGQSDYPYSRSLAERLVRQVHDTSREFRFDSVIDKRQHYLLAGCIVLGLSVVGLFISRNVLYLSCYMGRLLRPFSQIEPVPATVLESVTQDIVVARDAPVTLTVAVRGRPPESAVLVLTGQGVQDVNDAAQRSESVQVDPTVDSQGNATFSVTTSFDTLGLLTYRFEADGIASDPHVVKVCEPPAIKNITASVSLPQTRPQAATTYSKPVEDGTLEVLPHSDIEFLVESTVPLSEATAVAADGQSQTHALNGAQTFTVRLAADKPSSVEFKLVSVDGLRNSEPQQVRILLKSDEPPQFSLLMPDGDYLTTDVASVPIVFDVSDDFGLDSARLCCEFPDGRVMVVDARSPEGARQVSLMHTLELEEYPLEVGDSILFYAKAIDIDTGQRKSDANACSEIYFIEIRPYQQYWHPDSDGPSSQPGIIPEDLIAVLEYTRASLKKTWTLANEAQLTDESRSRMESLRGDVTHCGERLAHIRDDPDYGFTEPAKAELSRVVERYERASDSLQGYDAVAALPPMKDAYRLLRHFIDELHLKWTPPQSGQSPPPRQERVRLQEQPQDSKVDDQRTENQLEELQRKIEKLAREQESLNAGLKDTLQQQQQTAENSQSGGSSSSGSDPSGRGAQRAEKASQNRPDPAAQRISQTDPQAAQGEEMQSGDGKRSAGQSVPASADAQSSPAQQGGQQEGSSDQAGSQGADGSEGAPGSNPGGSAQAAGSRSNQRQSSAMQTGADGSSGTADARLRMLEARQKALHMEAGQVQAALGQLPVNELSQHGRTREQAKEHVDHAVEKMTRFEEKLTGARYAPSMTAQEIQDVSELADSASRELAEAGKAIRQGLSAGKPQTAGEKARDMAEQLAEDAEALDESLSPAERQRMLERLEAAKRLLESMAGPQWATVSGGSTPGGMHVYTKDAYMKPAETARMLARQFWSIAIEAREKGLQPVAEEPSDAEFFEAESQFFESAARYAPPRDIR